MRKIYKHRFPTSTDYPEFSFIWLKDIDQVNNPEIEKLILSLFDSTDSNQWKYKSKIEKAEEIEIGADLSRIIFIITTSTSKPKIAEELQTKLSNFEPFLDKYFWVLFFSSLVLEGIAFFFIIRQHKTKKNLGEKFFE